MKVILYNAVSLDGFIATPSGDSDWTLDDKEFEAHVNSIGCILIGRKTFHQYQGEIYPLDPAINFVYTHEPERHNTTEHKNLHFVGGSPQDVLNEIKQYGSETVLLGGGAETNSAFAQAGLINEMILDIHPIILGNGLRLLGDSIKLLRLELISSQNNTKGFVQNHYLVSGT